MRALRLAVVAAAVAIPSLAYAQNDSVGDTLGGAVVGGVVGGPVGAIVGGARNCPRRRRSRTSARS